MVHALGEGDKRITNGSLADVTDDAGCDLMIVHLAPRGGEVALGEACLVEFILQLSKLLAGEFLRAGDDGEKGGDLVAVGIDEVLERLDVILGSIRIAEALGYFAKTVRVMGDEDGLGGAIVFAVEDFPEAGVFGEPGGDFRERHGAEMGDERVGRQAGGGFKILSGSLAEVTFFPLDPGD